MADMVTRVYTGFRGVDFRGEEINLVRSPDSLNVWKDYKETESIRTRPGLEIHYPAGEPVYGIFFYKGEMLVHQGNGLHRVRKSRDYSGDILWSGLIEAPSNGFVFEDVFYFKDGKFYLQYDGTTIKEVEGYVPTTRIAGKPSGGGKDHQDFNMLTGRRKNSFLADGSSKVFYLDAQNIDDDFKPIVTFTDQEEISYTVDYKEGKITFADIPSAPLTDGQDNILVEFKKTISKYRDSILKCTLLQVFDNRVFVSGNPDYPNVVWHCSLEDPSYFSDTDYYREGMDSSAWKRMEPLSIWPEGPWIRRMTDMEVTDLPQPDSPTTPTTEWRGTS